MKAQLIKIFVVLLLTVAVFISACGTSNNTPSTPSQNNYEFEVVGNNLGNIAYYINNSSIVGVIPVTTDWTYNFQASSGEDYWFEDVAGCCTTNSLHLWKNGIIVEATTTTNIAALSGNLP